MPPASVRPPVSVRREATMLIGVAGAFCAALALWAALAQLDAGALAPGEVIPSGRVKTVQHLEGGIILSLSVKDGDPVKQGQELLRLDETQARAELEIQRTERMALEALAGRLTAERDGVAPAAAAQTGLTSVDNQMRLFEARRASLARESAAYRARMAQARKELIAWQSREAALERSLRLAGEETRMNRTLVAQNFIARPRVLQLESREADVAASLQETAAEKARVEQKITDAGLALSKLEADWMTSVLEDLRKTHEALAQARERELVAARKLSRTRVVAPQDGRVQNLRFFTVGGVIQPGGAVMDIVPQSEELVVEARISPDDIDVVRAGLPSRVRLTAYRTRTQIALDAVVTEVSADAFRDDKRNISYFTARVRIRDAQALAQHRMAMNPGMQAEVEIVTGRRSVLRYLFDPLIDASRRGFWES